MIVISPVLLLGVIFLVLRLHINILWNWGLIFIPFWFALLIWIFLDVYGIVKAKASPDHAIFFVSGLGAVCVALFLAFVTVKLEVHPGWPWAAVISPLWASLLMYMILLLTHSMINSHAILLGITYLTLVPASIMIAIKLDSEATSIVNLSWGVVFIPLWALYGTWLVALIVAIVTKMERNPSSTRNKPYWINVYVLSLLWIGTATFLVLLTVELESPGSIGYLFVFTPNIITLAVTFFGPYFLLSSRRRMRTKEKYLPWLTGLTPIFNDFGPPIDVKTGMPLWKDDDETSATISRAQLIPVVQQRQQQQPEDVDRPMTFIQRTRTV